MDIENIQTENIYFLVKQLVEKTYLSVCPSFMGKEFQQKKLAAIGFNLSINL